MSEPKLPLDVDGLARRLPRREPPPERALAMRHAIVDAAQGQGAPARIAGGHGWWIGVAAAAAACVATWLVLRAPARPAPSGPAPTMASAASPAAAPAPGSSAAPAAARSHAPAAVAALGVAVATPGSVRIPDGVTAFAPTSALTLSRGDDTITAPPAARFDVEVTGDQVKRITVTEGWVVVAGAHATTTTIVPMRHTWTPPAPPPAAAASATAIATSPAPSAITAPAARSAASRLAAAGSQAPSAEPVPGTPAAPSPPRALPAAAERDFRDGLRTLLAGDPAAASAALDRACNTPSSSQDDACYWAAVAWLRSGDHNRARRGFQDLLTRWPGSGHVGEANVAFGWLLLEVGDTAGARTRFAAAADDRLPSIRSSALRGLAATQ